MSCKQVLSGHMLCLRLYLDPGPAQLLYDQAEQNFAQLDSGMQVGGSNLLALGHQAQTQATSQL